MLEQGLEMKSISKKFPGLIALDKVDFSVNKGEIHALVGANGAGKSTLMKVLSGATLKTSGEVYIDGKLTDIKNPLDAMKHKIVTVYQEVDTALVPNLTVAENLMMDYISSEQKSFLMNWSYIKKTSEDILNSSQIKLDSSKLVLELTLAEKQLLLIARAIYQKAQYLILDEPTASLSTEECEKLFHLVKKLSLKGVTIIFISHRLDEIFHICQNISILRDGKMVGSFNLSDETVESIVEKMLGKKLNKVFLKREKNIGKLLVEAKNISGEGGIKNASIKVHRGEIVGLSGLVGGGKTELLKLLFGASSITKGQIFINGHEIFNKNPGVAIKNGFSLVPEERRKEGVLVSENVETNITLPTLNYYCKSSFINKKKLKDIANKTISKVNIKVADEKQIVETLSGGNQQKVAIGKWLISNSEIYLFDEPTKGIDVGSKHEIYNLINDLASQGKGVIYASCEFEEILGLSDRAYVMYGGKIVKEVKTDETNEEELLLFSTGGKDE